MNMIALFRKAVSGCSNQTAVVDLSAGRRTTYGELDILSSRVAGKLHQMGIDRGSFVLIHMDRHMEYVAAMLGTLKAGCIFVPTTPDYPRERIDYIAEHCGSRLEIHLDFFSDIDTYEPFEDLADDDEPAVLAYTSGSTGAPKGILQTSGALSKSSLRHAVSLQGLKNDRFACIAPLSFIAGFMYIMGTLVNGTEVHIVGKEDILDVRRLAAYFAQHRIGAAFLTGQLLRTFPEMPGPVERIFAGGEKLSDVKLGHYELVNAYGMSEMLGYVTTFRVDRVYLNTPVGKSVGGMSVCLLDKDGKIVCQGEEGELCVAGNSDFTYFRNPEATSAAFSTLSDGTTVYHTGDIGYENENGDIVYVNRKDWMVKINGQRVETQEIEHILRNVPGIADAAVKAFKDRSRQNYLCAYCVSEMPLAEDMLRAKLAQKLPEYMIPRFFIPMKALPRNVNGKLDRKALPEPEAEQFKAEYAEPHTDVQKRLCDGFEQLLECGKVGILDDFFSLGGDSIKVIRLLDLLCEPALTTDMILRGRTPEGIAALHSGCASAPIDHVETVPTVCPMTDSQRGVYLECAAKPESTMYNIPMLMRLPEHTDAERFAAAVRTVAAAHPVLNVTMRASGDTPEMVYQENGIILTEKHVDDLGKELADFVKPFDLENGPLYRFELCHYPGGTVFLLDVHHLIFDGSSVNALATQISEAYENSCCLPEQLTIFDVSRAEAALGESERYRDAQQFFRDKLEGIEPETRPAYDVRFSEEKDEAGHLSVSASDYFSPDIVRHFVKKRGLTENSLFLGAFAYLLSKYANTATPCFCTADSGRHDPRLASSLGMFVRTLPICCPIDETLRVDTFLKTVQADFFETMRHDCISFGELAAAYGVSSDIAFIYQSDLFREVKLADGMACVEAIPTGNVAFDMQFMLFKGGDGYRLSCDFRQNNYSASLIRAFMDSYLHIVAQMMTQKELGRIELVSPRQNALLDSFHRSECAYEDKKTVVEQFREQAKRHPDKTAVVCTGKKLTYGEADDLSERIGAFLHAKGIGRENVVGILVSRSEIMPVAAMGVLKAGAAYQPLDDSYPTQRLEFMLEDASVRYLIADEELLEKVPGYRGPVLLTKDIPFLPEGPCLAPAPRPEDLLILLYTSGTTGVPKGCMLEHRNLMALIAQCRSLFDLDENTRIANYASFGFDASLMDFFSALSYGCELHIIASELRMDLTELDAYFIKHEINCVFMTTQVGRQFAMLTKCPSLRALFVGGEALVPVDMTGKHFGLYNGYGPSECCAATSVFRVDGAYRRIPIGKPLGNFKTYIVDQTMRRLPIGAPGELLIAGPQVSRGYLNRPEKTAEGYVSNPFCHEPGYDRVYRSGDTVRMLPDGMLDFIGRSDEQVKVRGFRIELTEVEEVIRRFTDIKDATVTAFDAPSGGKALAAYVVADEKIDLGALNDFIRSEKPAYMVPAVTMQLDSIPLTANQKVNKRALPVPTMQTENITPPENDVQQKIYDLLREVLGDIEFGVDSDIDFLGFSSIGAVRLNVLLADTFHKSIRIADFRTHNTVRKLEELIKTRKEETAAEMQSEYPLSKTQEGVFLADAATEDKSLYDMIVLLKLDERIDLAQLSHAVVAAVNAHPYMKAKLRAGTDGSIIAVRNDDAEPLLEIVDTNALPSREELLHRFNLLGEPLYLTRIFRTGAGNYLYLNLHHIIGDGESLAILMKDIERVYGGDTLEKEGYTGFEYALSEEDLRNSDRFQQAQTYYHSLLQGCDTNMLPSFAPETNPDASIDLHYTMKNNVQRIKAYCQEHRLTLNAFFNAVFGFVLCKFNNTEENIYTTIYNGRSDSRTVSAVSMFVKTFPVVARISPEAKITDYVSGVGAQLMESMENDLYSFEDVSSDLGVKADIIFAYQGDQFRFDRFCGFDAEMIEVPLKTPKAPISINIYLRGDTFLAECNFCTKKYSSAFMTSLMGALETAADEFMSKEKLADISILSDEYRERLDRFNDTDVPFDNIPVGRLFEKWAKQTPDQIAVIDAEGSLTFDELNRQANQIAHSLIELGVGKDDVVGIIVERTEDIAIAELAVLKSGGAFLAILPSYPDERIDFCLADASCKFVLTTGSIREERHALFGAEKPYRAMTVEELSANENEENPAQHISPDSLAYCIYTSGSTGTPKGIMIEHHNLANLLQTFSLGKIYYQTNTGGRSLALASFSFDSHIVEILLPLCCGRGIVIATEAEVHNPLHLAALIEKQYVDALVCTPSNLMNLLSISEFKEAFMHIRAVVVAAEAFPEKLYTILRELSPDMLIINGYGPSECTVSSSCKTLDGGAITIGSAADNYKYYVLDKCGHILPEYAAGELIICGEGVGRGYIGLPEKNKAAFFRLNGLPAYRSGDVVRLDRNGEALFSGRADNQVKLRGYRVELDEIEKVMQSYPGVSVAKVIVRSNGSEDYLAGFFTAEKQIDLPSLTAHLKGKLTYYMVPAALMQLDAMPLTVNGKIDKKALPEVTPTKEHKQKRKAPKKSLEQRLCELFGAVLKLDEYYADDNFFEMGGTSLTASKVIMNLMSDHIEVVYQDIFEHPTPEELAAFIEAENAQSAAKDSDTHPLEEERSEFSKALSHNTREYVNQVERHDLGDVLLTGATGFLGIHILHELIRSETGHIHCLVRSSTRTPAERKLKNMLMYYFDDTFDDLLGNRITVIDADITDGHLTEALSSVKLDTVINCAACVKHYASDDVIEKINVGGVRNLIGLCTERNIRMIQISTVSIPGVHTAESYKKRVELHENECFVVDSLDNKYGLSKYRAEQLVLEGVENGLRGKIIRVGNLMGRYVDGEFQINFNSNAFVSGIRGFATLGKCPVSHMTDPMKFSPIDLTARAVVLLSGTNDMFTVFHADNRYGFDEKQMIDACCRCGVSISIVPDEEYYNDYYRSLGDERINRRLQGLMTNDRPDLHIVDSDNQFTADVLYRLGFTWPLVSNQYLNSAVMSLKTLGFFDMDDGVSKATT